MKRSRHRKFNAKKKARKATLKQDQDDDNNSSFPSETVIFNSVQQQIIDSSPAEEITNVIFNSAQHRTQGGSKKLSDSDKIRYLKDEWTCVPLCTSCRIPSNVTLIPIKQEVSVEQLLIERLIRQSKKFSGNNFDEIPSEFYNLAKSITEPTNNQSTNIDKEMWINFGVWLNLKMPIRAYDVRKYLITRWNTFNHITEVRKTKDSEIPDEVFPIDGKGSNTTKREMKDKAQDNNIKNFRFITNPECVVDKHNRTLVHLGELDNNEAVNIATEAINNYYFHMIQSPTHRSKSFWNNLAERFGSITTYNELPYTTSDTASSHNIEHQDCVNNLLYALQPISNSVNRFVNKYYEHYYIKLSKLSWGPFSPRSFGIFPTIAINFNAISNYHWDSNDNLDGLCFLVALGDFEGGELCFPQLQIVVKLKPGQVVAFPSCLLLHGNLPITKGIRFSIVYFVHQSFFSRQNILTKLENSLKNDKIIQNQNQNLYDSQGLNPTRPLLKNIQKWQIEEPSENDATDRRRNQEELKRARKGMRAEDSLK